MRIAKVPGEVVTQKVWESLCNRMDPETHLVHPSWLTMMREIHVCRQRIADAIRGLKNQGKLRVVEVPKKGHRENEKDYLYEVVQ